MNDTRPTIGVIGSPALAGALQQTGLAEVISGRTAVEAAEAVEKALRERPDLSLVVVVGDDTAALPRAIIEHDLRPRRMVTLIDKNSEEYRDMLDDAAINPRQMPLPLNVLMGIFGEPSTPESMSLWLSPDGQEVVRRGGPQSQQSPQPMQPQPSPAPEPGPQRAAVSVNEPAPEPVHHQPDVPAPQTASSQATPVTHEWRDEQAEREAEREQRVAGMERVALLGENNGSLRDNDFLPDAPTQQGQAPVVFVGAPKGGVGKSTASIALSNRAAQRLNPLAGDNARVVWIEGDIGHAQAAHHFGLERVSALPTVFDYHLSRSVKETVVPPGLLQEHRRNPKLPGFGFGVVLAPTKAELDKNLISATTYREIIHKLRKQTDLVVVDLHQFSAVDKLKIMEQVVVPMVRDDTSSWLLVLNDLGRTASASVDEWIAGVTSGPDALPASRIITVQNDIPVDPPEDGDRHFATQASGMAKALERHSHYAGIVWRDNEIIRLTNATIPVGDHKMWRYPMDEVLARVLGLPNESEPYNPYADAPGFFSRLLGRAKK